MSRAQIGASLLAEIQEVSLDDLLRQLRHSIESASGAATGVSELDRLLSAVQWSDPTEGVYTSTERHQDETDAHYLHDEHDTSSARPFRPRDTKRETPLIEISSSGAQHESTDLCYYLTAKSILPDEDNRQDRCTVWLDTETRFSASRLYRICLSELTTQQPHLKPSEADQIVKQALKHVHVFSAQSSKQVLAILDILPIYLLGPDHEGVANRDEADQSTIPEHHSAHKRLSLLILDSATSFHWSDRFDAELVQLESTTRSNIRPNTSTDPSSSSPTSQIITKLKSIQATFDCVVVYTTDKQSTSLHSHTHHPIPATSHQSHHHQHHHSTSTDSITPQLPRNNPIIVPTLLPWTKSATLSLTLSHIPTPQFATHMSIQDCIRDRERRAEIVRANRVKVSLDKLWVDRVLKNKYRDRDGLKSMLEEVGSGFVMKCNDEGVVIER